MEAAARGEGYTIAYGGTAQYDYAPDVGRAFALAARAATDGAHVANFPGVPSTMQEVVEAIEAAAPAVGGQGHVGGGSAAVPGGARRPAARAPRSARCTPTPLADGVRATIEHFRSTS